MRIEVRASLATLHGPGSVPDRPLSLLMDMDDAQLATWVGEGNHNATTPQRHITRARGGGGTETQIDNNGRFTSSGRQ